MNFQNKAEASLRKKQMWNGVNRDQSNSMYKECLPIRTPINQSQS